MFSFSRIFSNMFMGISLILLSVANNSYSQISTNQLNGGNLNAINTAVPFVTIAPDSRSGGLGEVGVASAPDFNSQHWNVAKYGFIEGTGGVSVSYTPWLRRILPDINLAYVSSYFKPNSKQAISASLRYFSLGLIEFRDAGGSPAGQFTPYEMAFDVGYSRLLGDHLSGGILFRYIYSNLARGQDVLGTETNPGVALASDIGIYYENQMNIGGNDGGYAWGVSLTNLGTPIAYMDDSERLPIPSNLRIGGRIDYSLDENNSFSLMIDFNKLLVPTNPYMAGDSVIMGYPDPASVVLGMVRSFYDAPGIRYDDGSYSSVFREELAEVTVGTGIEYWYREQFAVRAGYFHEASVKGNRKFVTLGVGMQLNMFAIDFAYLIPTNGMDSPLANTLRFTLGFDLDAIGL